MPPSLPQKTVHKSRLTVYLPDSLDFDPLPTNFVWISACE